MMACDGPLQPPFGKGMSHNHFQKVITFYLIKYAPRRGNVHVPLTGGTYRGLTQNPNTIRREPVERSAPQIKTYSSIRS